MTERPGRWLELLFTYEELDEPTRARVDAELARSPGLRALRDALRDRESRAKLAGALPERERWPALPLDDAGHADEAGSLRALLERVAPAVDSPRVKALSAPRFRLRMIAPLVAAAALLAVVLWPRGTNVVPVPAPAPAPVLGALTIERGAGVRGGEAGERWRSGDAFVLRMELREPAAPVIFLLDAAGELARLHPGPGGSLRTAPAGSLLLPPAGAHARWRFEGGAGRETFFALALTESAGLESLTARATAAVEGRPRREMRVAALDSTLRRLAPEVRRLDVEHR